MRLKTCLSVLYVCGVSFFAAAEIEMSIRPVAVSRQPAPSVAANFRFGSFDDFSLANDGWIAFHAQWQNPPGPPDFGSFAQGLFIARAGLVLTARRDGSDIHVTFPTLAGKHYRVDYTDSLPPPTSWPVLDSSVSGNGGQITVTNLNAASLNSRYYRVVRTD